MAPQQVTGNGLTGRKVEVRTWWWFKSCSQAPPSCLPMLSTLLAREIPRDPINQFKLLFTSTSSDSRNRREHTGFSPAYYYMLPGLRVRVLDPNLKQGVHYEVWGRNPGKIIKTRKSLFDLDSPLDFDPPWEYEGGTGSWSVKLLILQESCTISSKAYFYYTLIMV